MDKSNLYFLLGRFLDTEFNEEFLANISAENFTKLKKHLQDIFEDLTLTDADTKEAWKAWFDWAAYNGTIINHNFQIVDPECSWSHEELRLIDLTLELANSAIDKL